MNKRMKSMHMASLCMLLLTQSVAAATPELDKRRSSVKGSVKAGKLLAAAEINSSAENNLSQLVDKFFDFRFKSNPDSATVLGFHQYDALAPDMSKAGIKEQVEQLKLFQKQFDALKAEALSAQSKIDLQLIKSQIKASLLDLEDIRSWEKNPDIYSSHSSSMIYDLMSRDFAPLSDRIKLVIAREKKIGEMLKAGKANLVNPPKIYTEIAIEQIPGIIDLFQNSVTEKFKSVSDKNLQSEFQASNNNVIAELKDYQTFLKEQLLPKSNGEFALGSDFYSKKLLYEEMEDSSIDDLLARGEAELKRLQSEFLQTAKEIDPNKSVTDVFTAISSDHTTPDKLVSSVQGVLDHLRQYCVDKNIITIPAKDALTVQETPPFMRALTFASMDQSGPFEQKAKEAYYYVTLPEPGWSAQRVEEHMRAFSKYDLINTSVHEAFPGHFVQGLWTRVAPSKTSKILGCNSNIEGWAHYCEQMMVEEGLDNGDKNLKMTMLHDALLRVCRYIVGIRMHTRGMSIDEGINYFVKEGYQEKANAERETKRGTSDPTYLVYTLGKLQLLALREDYKKMKGSEYSLKDFHDRVMATGTPPVKIIRQVLMGDAR